MDLYEAKDKFSGVGAGIALWRRTWYIMQILGLDVPLREVALNTDLDTPSKFHSSFGLLRL